MVLGISPMLDASKLRLQMALGHDWNQTALWQVPSSLAAAPAAMGIAPSCLHLVDPSTHA